MRAQRNSSAAFRAAVRSLFLWLMLLSILGWLGYQGWQYLTHRHALAIGTTIAGIDVGGLSAEEATALIQERYSAPVMGKYREEVVSLNPADAGFVIDVEGMVAEAIAVRDEVPQWQRYLGFVLRRPLDPIHVRLRASHDPAAVRDLVGIVANLLDKPAVPPQLLSSTGQIELGSPGHVTDIEASAQRVENALYQSADRVVEFVVQDQPAPGLDMSFLQEHLKQQLSSFPGIGSIYVLDLETGEEVRINADVAVSGLSIVKIAIMLEMFRAVDGPLNSEEIKLLNQTAIFSGNFSANLLLDIVAGQDNAYLGVDILTESMHRLGLKNTFIATPYDEPARAGKSTYVTAANSRTDISMEPDPAMQTTAEEMGMLLSMIYDCAKGGGALIAAYGDQITAEECQLLIDTMVQNTEGNLIRFGVPEEVPVAHKHGWAFDTHGDAGIVFSPGGDYVIVEYLYQDTDWLPTGISFPLLRNLSRSVYNYYNVDAPYYDEKRAQKAAGKYIVELIKTQIEAGTLPPAETQFQPQEANN